MASKHYKATIYIQVVEAEADMMEELLEYCSSALRIDLDTEEYGNPSRIAKVQIDWATFAEASELDN